MEQTYYISMGPMGFAREDRCEMKVLRGHTQFSIEVEIARVKETRLGKELSRQIQLCGGYPFGRKRSSINPTDLVYQHCLPVLEKLAPQTSLQDLRLEYFLYSPTYHLKIVDAGTDGDVNIEGWDKCSYTPSFFTSTMRTADLPEAYKEIPRFRAREIRIAPVIDKEKSLDAIQGRVVMADGVSMYFKPRVEWRESEFDRELQIMSRIKKAGLIGRIRVPELLGIVVSGENGESTMGMLMTLITSPELGKHLESPGFHDKGDLHKKWEEQVTTIVRELHSHGIVWGDVNPMNVAIDEALDAWVIDFGGMNNAEFIDSENRETVEGDNQGITRLFHVWLPSRLKRYEEYQGPHEAPVSHR